MTLATAAPERATFEFKTTAVGLGSGSGEFSGWAAVFNNIDDQGDKILPGAFKRALPAFLAGGTIPWSHDLSRPVAYPVGATEADYGLKLSARFHSTAAGQEARQLVTERAGANLTPFGLSIGYVVGDYRPTSYGREIHSIERLFEVSLVAAPANRLAVVTGVKGGIVARAVDRRQEAAEIAARKAARELGIDPPRVRFVPLKGMDGEYRHELPGAIWLRSDLPEWDLPEIVAHECAHLRDHVKGDYWTVGPMSDDYYRSMAASHNQMLERKAQDYGVDFRARWGTPH